MTKTKIHTMYDDLVSVRPSVNVSHKKNNPAKLISQPKSFPLPPRPNNRSLTLPAKPKPLQPKKVHWFIIGAAILIVLNIIIWGIAIME